MKVVFKVIRSGSGNDVYFGRLSQALKEANIDSEIEYYHKYFQYFPWLLRVVNKKTSGDIIHSNVEYGWVFKEKNKPLYVSLLHNVFEKEYQRTTSIAQKIYHYFIIKPNIKLSLKKADKVIAISNYTKQSFKKYFNFSDITVIYCSIDTNKFMPSPVKSNDKRFKLLFVGNLIKRKGADLLPKIMDKLGSGYVLYYTSGLRSEIPNEFKKSNMIPLGKLTEAELIREYNKCDALLFPTKYEGFGYAVAEAMACGKPIISTNTSSIPEIVEDKVNGYLCKINNTDDYVERVKKLKKDLNKKSEYFNLNRHTIEKKFNMPKILEQCKKIYMSI